MVLQLLELVVTGSKQPTIMLQGAGARARRSTKISAQRPCQASGLQEATGAAKQRCHDWREPGKGMHSSCACCTQKSSLRILSAAAERQAEEGEFENAEGMQARTPPLGNAGCSKHAQTMVATGMMPAGCGGGRAQKMPVFWIMPYSLHVAPTAGGERRKGGEGDDGGEALSGERHGSVAACGSAVRRDC